MITSSNYSNNSTTQTPSTESTQTDIQKKIAKLHPDLQKIVRDNYPKFLRLAHKNKIWPEDTIKAELHKYVLDNFRLGGTPINIPIKPVCSNHCAPFDFVYDAFMSKYEVILAMANRSGGKTISMAVLATLNALANDECEIYNLGAILVQAQWCSSYVKSFINANPDFQARLLTDPTTEKIKWLNGSINQILTASMKAVNGPHPQKLIMDEVELTPWPILQEAFSTVQSKHGIDGVLVLGSTRKFSAGPMQRFVADYVSKGIIKMYDWCVWDVVEALPDDPQEVKSIKEVFGDELHPNVEQCCGYYKWKDLVKKFTTLDRNVWITQWVCKRPDTQGLVYSRFDDTLNLDKDFKVDRNALVNGWARVYIFEDFGSTKDHPDVVLYAWHDMLKNTVTIFDELYSIDKGTNQIVDEALAKLSNHGLAKSDIAGWIGDPHAVGEQIDRYNLGLPMMGNRFVSDESQKVPGELLLVKNGVSHMRKFIDDRRLKITENVPEFRAELMSYAYGKRLDGTYKDEPEKKNDHGPDCCRQGLIWLFPMEAAGSFGSDAYTKEEDTKYDTYTGGLWEKRF